MSVMEDILRRLADLEEAAKAPMQEATYARFKFDGEVVKGNVYILTITDSFANLLIMGTAGGEGDVSPVVIAAESKTDNIGEGKVWVKCVTTGLVWINFETGLDPIILDYVICSSDAGLAKTVSNSESGAFGRLLRWDDYNSRGFVLVGISGGGAIPIKVWRQNDEPTPQADVFNIWEDLDDGHAWYYDFFNTRWVDWAGWV